MSAIGIPLRCHCGEVTGSVDAGGITCRGACYCLDCRGYAHFLGNPERILDEKGGSQILGTLPRRVHITAGAAQIAGMTMTPRGPLRWYAECCRTPLGNTTRSAKAPYVSVLRCALAASDEQLRQAFGPANFVFSPETATAPVRGTPLAMAAAVFKVVANLLYGRLSGQWRQTPFFLADGQPIRTPQVIDPQTRQRLRNASGR